MGTQWKPKKYRVCHYCGVVYVAESADQATCRSAACRRKHQAALARQRREKARAARPKATRRCATCGKRFTPRGSAQKYCSSGCRPRRRRRTRSITVPRQGTCPQCGMMFRILRPNQVTCGSDACRKQRIVELRRVRKEASRASMERKPCPICGEPIPAVRHGRRATCGAPQCREKWSKGARAQYWQRYYQQGSLRRKNVERRCLKCDRTFRSYSGFRLCGQCRKENAEIWGSEWI